MARMKFRKAFNKNIQNELFACTLRESIDLNVWEDSCQRGDILYNGIASCSNLLQKVDQILLLAMLCKTKILQGKAFNTVVFSAACLIGIT